MPSDRWINLLPLVIGSAAIAVTGEASAFQRVPQLSDPIHTRPIHDPEAWAQRGFTSPGPINQSPADYGPAIGMSSRTPTGEPASGDRFPVMMPGPLPGGLAPHGFNSSGMNPPVNQPDSIANNPLFGGPGSNQNAANSGNHRVGPNGSMGPPFGPNGQPLNQQFHNGLGSSPQRGPNGFSGNGSGPNGPGTIPGDGRNRAFGDPRMTGGNARGSFGPGANSRGPTTPASRRPRMQTTATSALSDRPAVVGLLGQFARPGSYEIGTEPLTLGQLIEHVGGMAKDAAGQLKVIRNGRPGQTLAMTGAEQFELMPSDLVIAESTSGTNHSPVSSSSQPEDSPSRGATGVQIGFLNLLDRPVVLKLRSEHANVAAILNIMQQDSSLAGKVQVILPSSHRFSGRVHPNMPLPSESVVMFPPNVVATDRLAGLPAPTKLKASANPESSDPAQSGVKLPNSSPSASSPLGLNSSESQGASDEVPAPPSETFPSTANGQAGSGLRLPTSAIGAGHEAAESSDAASAPPVPSLNADEPTRFNTPGQHRPIDGVKSADKSSLDSLEINDGSESNPSGWGNVAPMVIIALSLSGLLGLSLWLRRRTVAERHLEKLQLTRRRAPTPDVVTKSPMRSADEERSPSDRIGNPIGSVERTSVAKRALLESLIQNQVPMTEERVAFASPMHFHGRPNAPQFTRIDVGHEIPKPHVSAADETAQQPFVPAAIADAAKGQTRIDRSEKASAPASSRSAFERALTTVRGREERP